MSSKIRTKLPKKYGNGREKILFYNASAVVGYPHDIKGQGIYAFVLFQGHEDDPMLAYATSK
jgi:hypothetical protein